MTIKKTTLSLTTMFFAAVMVNAQLKGASGESDFLAFSMDSLAVSVQSSNKKWLPFLESPNILGGIYQLKVGEEDNQRPHETDEIYYVVSGKAKFECLDNLVEVKTGSVLFVKHGVEHRFVNIEEDLVVLVVFDK